MTPSEGRLFSSYAWKRDSWQSRVDTLEPDLPLPRHVAGMLRAAKGYPLLVLDGFARGDLVAAAAIARWRRPPKLLILDPTWKVGSSPVDRTVTRAVVRVIDGTHVSYGILSRFELHSFPVTWGIGQERVRFIPWHYDLSEDELQEPVETNGSFFTGGDSLRDFGTVLRAAELVDAPITVASRTVSSELRDQAPPHVTVGPVTRARYDELLRTSTAVILPLQVRADRSSGQGTLLNSMAHGKTVIVNDAPGIGDYVRHMDTALVFRSGDPDSLAFTMKWVLDNPEEAQQVGVRARQEVLSTFGPEQYVRRVLAAADEILGQRAG